MDVLPPIPAGVDHSTLYWIISVLAVCITAVAGALAKVWLQLQSANNARWEEKLHSDKWRAWAEGEMLRLTVLQDHQGDVLAIVSADAETGLITQWSSGAAYLFGYDSNEIKGKPIKKLIPERYLAKHEESLHKCVTERNRIPRHGPLEVHGLTKSHDEVPITIVYACYLETRHMFMAIIKRRNEEPLDDARGRQS